MKTIAKIGVLAVAILALVSIAVYASDDTVVIENPPKMAVGDEFIYQGFKSLDDAKNSENPEWIAINKIIEVKDDGGYVKKAGNRISDQRGGHNTIYKPFWPKFKYPLKVGDKYKVDFSHNRTDRYDNNYVATVRVVGWETVTVPAGTFKALKIEMEGYWTHLFGDAGNIREGRADFKEISWVVPELKMQNVLYLWEASWGTGSREIYSSLKMFNIK